MLLWLTRSPGLSFRVIQLEGELQRNSVATIRANATPRLAGNFISIDLDKARAAFESVPWVRQATLRRIWPDRLAVRLDEHHPVALWLGEDGNERLVNDFGEVFEANVGDVEDENLPQFSGPEGSSAPMLALYRRLSPLVRRAAHGAGGHAAVGPRLVERGAGHRRHAWCWAAAPRTNWSRAASVSCAP